MSEQPSPLPLQVWEGTDGYAHVKTDQGDREVPIAGGADLGPIQAQLNDHQAAIEALQADGGGQIPPDLLERLTILELWRPTVDERLLGIEALIAVLQQNGAEHGRMMDLLPADIEWWQDNHIATSEYPGTGRVRISSYWDADPNYPEPPTTQYPRGKFVCQGFYVPGGLSWLTFLLVFGGRLCIHMPDVDPIQGGGWEWKLPWPLRRGRPDDGQGTQPRLRGYLDFQCSCYSADKTFHMAGIGKMRTDGPDLSEAYVAMNVGLYPHVLQKGALNYRNPFLIADDRDPGGVLFKVWTPGSWLKWSITLPTD